MQLEWPHIVTIERMLCGSQSVIEITLFEEYALLAGQVEQCLLYVVQLRQAFDWAPLDL